MNRNVFTCCIVCLLVPSSGVVAQEWDLGEYHEQLTEAGEPAARSTPPTSVPALKAEATIALSTNLPAAGELSHARGPEDSSAADSARPEPDSSTELTVHENVQVGDAQAGTIIRFGAGASWMHPLRLSDKASDDRLMTEFSASWAPFGLQGEIGFDFLIARDQKFVVRPNLKFYFFKHPWFSLFMEGACEVLFLAEGTELGGGGGLGVVIGLADNLAIELKGSASIYSMTPEGSQAMFGSAQDELDVGGRQLAVLPAATIRLMARF